MEPFSEDVWGLTDILRACDRRIGTRRLLDMRDNVENDVIRRIIDRRIGISLFDEHLNIKDELINREFSAIESDIIKSIRYYPGEDAKVHECDYWPSPFAELKMEQLLYIRENEEFRDFVSKCLEKVKGSQ